MVDPSGSRQVVEQSASNTKCKIFVGPILLVETKVRRIGSRVAEVIASASLTFFVAEIFRQANRPAYMAKIALLYCCFFQPPALYRFLLQERTSAKTSPFLMYKKKALTRLRNLSALIDEHPVKFRCCNISHDHLQICFRRQLSSFEKYLQEPISVYRLKSCLCHVHKCSFLISSASATGVCSSSLVPL